MLNRSIVMEEPLCKDDELAKDCAVNNLGLRNLGKNWQEIMENLEVPVDGSQKLNVNFISKSFVSMVENLMPFLLPATVTLVYL